MSRLKSFSNTYLKRRTIKAGEKTECIIKSIESDRVNNVYIIIEAADEYYKVDMSNTIENQEFISKLLDLKISDKKTLDMKFNLYFNKNMDKCGFEKDEYEYDLEYIGKNYDNKKINDNAINKILLESEYNKTSPLENGWSVKITDVNEISEDEFKITIETENLVELEFNISVPLTTESESSEIAKLIEEQGGGHPEYIQDEGEIYLIKKQDVPNNLDVISSDTNGNWCMVNKSTLNNWERQDLKEKNNKNTKYTSSKSKSSTHPEKIKKFKQMRRQSILYLITLPILTTMVESLLPKLLGSSQEVTAITESIFGLIHSMNMIMMIFCICIFIYSTVRLSSTKSY